MDIAKALLKLRPGAKWTVDGNTYEGIVWLDDVQSKPTEQEINTELQVQLLEIQRTEYQRQRQAEYPPITDYLDGIVKGNQEQIDKYIADCLAVKSKYPKPE